MGPCVLTRVLTKCSGVGSWSTPLESPLVCGWNCRPVTSGYCPVAVAHTYCRFPNMLSGEIGAPHDAGNCCGRPLAWAPLLVFVEVGLRLVKPDVVDHHPPVVADHVLGLDRNHAVPVRERLDTPGPEVLFTALGVR